MKRIKVNEVVLVEGRYDASTLADQIDGLILTTDGFSIFSDIEKRELIKRLGKERGLLILTDSDAAGFRIRNYIEKIARGCSVKHVYIPSIKGKESRKSDPSKEGTLGVEGMSPLVLREALQRAGICPEEMDAGKDHGKTITYTDLYELGLSGTAKSAEKRRAFLSKVGLPARLSKKALCEVLSSLYSLEKLQDLLNEKPVLFWDFHGTLTYPDITWYDAAVEAAQEQYPDKELDQALLIKYLSRSCLPWWTVEDRDTRHLRGTKAWWGHCEEGFRAVFEKCGYTNEEAWHISPLLRAKVLDPKRYRLYPDVIETLKVLHENGYRSYILSNNYPELEALTRQLGLSPYISGVIVSGLVGFDKPRREIFDAALEAAGWPAEAWMIGDNPIDDIKGGKDAGFTTVAAHNIQSEYADHTIDNCVEVLDLLQIRPLTAQGEKRE